MRASRPIPGDRWPHDMVITVENGDHRILELLWIRAAWQLQSEDPDAPPPLDPQPAMVPTMQALRRDKRDWETAWSSLWHTVVAQAADPARHEAIHRALIDGHRGDRLAGLNEPSWRDRFGSDPFDDRYQAWASLIRVAPQPQRLEDAPERCALDALVPAWQRGLTQVVEIPCSGEHTRTIGQHGLLVTAATRAHPDRYTAALATFSPR
jgi:hypothetical protein